MFFHKKLQISLSILIVALMSPVAMAMQQDHQVRTINLQGEIDANSELALYQTVQKGLTQAQTRIQQCGMQCHFHVNDLSTTSKHYHISVSTFEAADATNNPLMKSDSNTIWNQAGKALTTNLATYNNAGHVYGIHLYVHGFDVNNTPINKHYPCVQNLQANLRNDFNINNGDKLTHFHIVGRYGTSHQGGPKGPFAIDCEQAIANLTTGTKFLDANRNCGSNFLGHITLAVVKRNPGIVDTNSQRFGTKFFDQIIGIYQDVADDYHQHTRKQNRAVPMTITKFHTNSR